MDWVRPENGHFPFLFSVFNSLWLFIWFFFYPPVRFSVCTGTPLLSRLPWNAERTNEIRDSDCAIDRWWASDAILLLTAFPFRSFRALWFLGKRVALKITTPTGAVYVAVFFVFSQTYIGEVLVSVNPYKPVSAYTDDAVFKYYNNINGHDNDAPHMWVPSSPHPPRPGREQVQKYSCFKTSMFYYRLYWSSCIPHLHIAADSALPDFLSFCFPDLRQRQKRTSRYGNTAGSSAYWYPVKRTVVGCSLRTRSVTESR